jgi:hypothetical protein
LAGAKVPYNSLMDALSGASPDILTEEEKNAVLEEPDRPASRFLSKRMLAAAGGAVLIALGLALGGYVYLHRGAHKAAQGHSQPATAAAQTAPAEALPPKEEWADIPLPARRPPAIAIPQESAPEGVRRPAEPAHGAQSTAAAGQGSEPNCVGWACPSSGGPSGTQ